MIEQLNSLEDTLNANNFYTTKTTITTKCYQCPL